VKKIALYFVGSDAQQIEAITRAVECIVAFGNRSMAWVFVVQPFMLKSIRQNFSITYIPTNRFVPSRFSTTVMVSNVFKDTHRTLWYETALAFLCDKFKIKIKESALEAVSDSPMNREKEISLCFTSVFNPCDGYGSSAEALAVAMARLDKQMHWDAFESFPDSIRLASKDGLRLVKESQRQQSMTIREYLLYYTPNGWNKAPKSRIARAKGLRLGLMTMFETTQLPSNWPKKINSHFDYVVVPAEFNKTVFEDSGVRIPIKVSPLGVDPERWPLLKRSLTKDRPFRFLLYSNTRWDCPRKNADLTLQAFRTAFPKDKNVELIIKTSFGGNVPRLRPNEKIIDGRLSQPKMLSLLQNVDCLVFASSGEGFGLPPREAMSTGLPVILCKWSALEDICIRGVSYWVNPKGLQDARIPGWLQAENNGSEVFGQFAEIDVPALAQKMRQVYREQDKAHKVGLAAAKWIRENNTYNQAAKSLLNITVPDRLVILEETKPILKGENYMKIEIIKITKRSSKRYIYFKVTNDSGKVYASDNKLHVRFSRAVGKNGKEASDPSYGLYELPKELKVGEVVEGRLTVDLKKTGSFVGQLGLVTEMVRWWDTKEVDLTA